MHTVLNVALGDRSYPIYIGDGVLARADLVLPHIRGKQVLLVIDKTPQGIRQSVMEGVFFVPLKSGIA